MASAQAANGSQGEPRGPGLPLPDTSLLRLVYRSQAAEPLSDAALQQLIRTAQARNRSEAVTGVLLYDEACFVQWLEGPPEGLKRIMQSIRRDPRHAEIEVLGEQVVSRRVFQHWDMQLATRWLRAAALLPDSITPPRELIDCIHHRPDAAPTLLVALAPVAGATGRGATVPPLAPARLRAILRDVAQRATVPELVARHGSFAVPLRPRAASGVSGEEAARLARLLLAADPQDAFALIDARCLPGGRAKLECAALFEPAARCLGDLWHADACSELEVTLGLARLHLALRHCSSGVPPRRVQQHPVPSVLVAAQPGEPHMLGAALDSELLWRAGWDTSCEYPADDAALQRLLAETWFDALDLSLSLALRRDASLPRLAATIAAARRASCNPSLVVVVGGRTCFEQEESGAQVGADAGSGTALRIEQAILRALRQTRTPGEHAPHGPRRLAMPWQGRAAGSPETWAAPAR